MQVVTLDPDMSPDWLATTVRVVLARGDQVVLRLDGEPDAGHRAQRVAATLMLLTARGVAHQAERTPAGIEVRANRQA